MFSACAPVSAEWAATHDISSHVEILHFFHLVSGNFYSSFLNQLVEFRSSLVLSFSTVEATWLPLPQLRLALVALLEFWNDTLATVELAVSLWFHFIHR